MLCEILDHFPILGNLAEIPRVQGQPELHSDTCVSKEEKETKKPQNQPTNQQNCGCPKSSPKMPAIT
jgi:hypothetical protein